MSNFRPTDKTHITILDGRLMAVIEQNPSDKKYDWKLVGRNGTVVAQSDARNGFAHEYLAIRSMRSFLRMVSERPLFVPRKRRKRKKETE